MSDAFSSRPLMSSRPVTKRTFSFNIPSNLVQAKKRKVENSDVRRSSRSALLQIQPNTDVHFRESLRRSNSTKEIKSTNNSVSSLSRSRYSNKVLTSETPLVSVQKKAVSRRLLDEFPASFSRKSDAGKEMSQTERRFSTRLSAINNSNPSQLLQGSRKDSSKVQLEVVHHSNVQPVIESLHIDSGAELSLIDSAEVNLKATDSVEGDHSVESDAESVDTDQSTIPQQSQSGYTENVAHSHLCLISPVQGKKATKTRTDHIEVEKLKTDDDARKQRSVENKKKVTKWLQSQPADHPSSPEDNVSEQLVIELIREKRFPLSEESIVVLNQKKVPRLIFEIKSLREASKILKPALKKAIKPKVDPKKKTGNVLKEVLVYNYGTNKHAVSQVCDLEVILSVMVNTFEDMRKEPQDERQLCVLQMYRKEVIAKVKEAISSFARLQCKNREVRALQKKIGISSEKLGKKVDEMLMNNAETAE